MGQSLDQLVAGRGEGYKVAVTLVANQDSGLALYAAGTIRYHPGEIAHLGNHEVQLASQASTQDNDLLKAYFSDRSGSIGSLPQPFWAASTDEMKLHLSFGATHVMEISFPAWGTGKARFAVNQLSNVLVGEGPSLGGGSPHAVWVASFHATEQDPR